MSGITEGQNDRQPPAGEEIHQQDLSATADGNGQQQSEPKLEEAASSISDTPFVAAFQSVASYYSRPSSPTVLFSGYPIDLQSPSFEEIDRAAARIGLEIQPFAGNLGKITRDDLPLLIVGSNGSAASISGAALSTAESAEAALNASSSVSGTAQKIGELLAGFRLPGSAKTVAPAPVAEAEPTPEPVNA